MPRQIIDKVISNMFSNAVYKKDYVFYAHILAQCRIELTDKIDIAAVNFKVFRYVLYINPTTFGELVLLEQMSVLKHEMLHILMGHISRKNERQHEQFNITADVAINQLITRDHLPQGCLYPDILQESLLRGGYNINIPDLLSAEQYYDLLPVINEEGEGKGGGFQEGEGQGEGDIYEGLWEDNPLDNHNIWDESEGAEDLKKDITKRMIDSAISKSRGNIPNNLQDILEIWNRPPQVSWKKVLRNVASNKRSKKKQTIMRKSRRFPNRPEIKGYKKGNDFTIIVVLDVSGSMNDDEIITGLNEVKEIATLTSSNIKIIQVDTEIKEVEDFKPGNFTRSGCGGTEMIPAFRYIKEKKMEMNACILISDMYIEDIDTWRQEDVNPKCKMIFLATEDRMPDLSNYSNYIGFKLDQA